jgi:hypothetical protein
MLSMTKALKEAIAEVATLPESDQELIGRELKGPPLRSVLGRGQPSTRGHLRSIKQAMSRLLQNPQCTRVMSPLSGSGR